MSERKDGFNIQGALVPKPGKVGREGGEAFEAVPPARDTMRLILLSAIFSAFFAPSLAEAGRIVLNHDEWTTSNTGFTQAGASATTFVQNVADFLNVGGGPGNFLAYSSDFSLTQSSFATALTSAGHSLTVSTAITFDLPTLQTFDAVFLAGLPGADTTVLTDYVNVGGGVYLAGGTFLAGTATGEANVWNPFLNNFGLAFQGGAYNAVVGNLPVTGTHSIFSGVSSLYYAGGNTVVLFGSNPNAQIVEATAGVGGLIAVYDDTGVGEPIPEPSTWTLLAIGLGAIGFAARRKQRSR